ncbi:uncharacterized protein [Parasteatoda tepidariorum]|uniref:uncharacterized protein n=1 Tax=Parasteatoda tepidariorum TaxID=114398 RepID=UPI0039BD87EC
MDKIQKQRKIVRNSFTRLSNQILNEMKSAGTKDLVQVKAKFKTLKIKKEELQKLDNELLKLMLQSDDITEEEIENESKSIDNYCNNYYEVETIFDEYFKDLNEENSSTNIEQPNRKFKLPKIELAKYDGSIKGWLSFWSLFKKIDEDLTLDPGDEFQYFLQCTVDNSRARELVLSYPATAENYSKVIESFKSRFGKDDVLVELIY